MNYGTKYVCKDCGAYKWVPERPLHAARSIKTGCENCGYISRHKAVGTP